MRWKGHRQSDNVEDRRGMSPKQGLAVGGSGLAIIVVIAGLLLGFNPQRLLQFLNQAGAGQAQQQNVKKQTNPAANDESIQFVKTVLALTEDVWSEQFRLQGMNQRYIEPELVTFTAAVDTGGCGRASSAVGPFYCPADNKIYIDFAFYDTLERQLNAGGDFAQAYVLAHEVGHHIQNLVGTSGRVSAERGRVSKEEYNRLSVRLELQADFLAGVWAHHAQKRFNILEGGDLDEAINAASQIGDDKLQMQSQGYTIPERYTHGTSAQRQRWFKKGFQSGRIRDGDAVFTLNYSQL